MITAFKSPTCRLPPRATGWTPIPIPPRPTPLRPSGGVGHERKIPSHRSSAMMRSPSMFDGEIILYTTEDGAPGVQLRAHDGTVWLSLKQIVDLFGRDK